MGLLLSSERIKSVFDIMGKLRILNQLVENLSGLGGLVGRR